MLVFGVEIELLGWAYRLSLGWEAPLGRMVYCTRTPKSRLSFRRQYVPDNHLIIISIRPELVTVMLMVMIMEVKVRNKKKKDGRTVISYHLNLKRFEGRMGTRTRTVTVPTGCLTKQPVGCKDPIGLRVCGQRDQATGDRWSYS